MSKCVSEILSTIFENASLDSPEETTTVSIASVIPANSAEIFLDCCAEVSASFLISSATTLNHFPASPA